MVVTDPPSLTSELLVYVCVGFNDTGGQPEDLVQVKRAVISFLNAL